MFTTKMIALTGLMALALGFAWFGAPSTVGAAYEMSVDLVSTSDNLDCLPMLDDDHRASAKDIPVAYSVGSLDDAWQDQPVELTCRGTCVKWGLSTVHLGYVCF